MGEKHLHSQINPFLVIRLINHHYSCNHDQISLSLHPPYYEKCILLNTFDLLHDKQNLLMTVPTGLGCQTDSLRAHFCGMKENQMQDCLGTQTGIEGSLMMLVVRRTAHTCGIGNILGTIGHVHTDLGEWYVKSDV